MLAGVREQVPERLGEPARIAAEPARRLQPADAELTAAQGQDRSPALDGTPQHPGEVDLSSATPGSPAGPCCGQVRQACAEALELRLEDRGVAAAVCVQSEPLQGQPQHCDRAPQLVLCASSELEPARQAEDDPAEQRGDAPATGRQCDAHTASVSL